MSNRLEMSVMNAPPETNALLEEPSPPRRRLTNPKILAMFLLGLILLICAAIGATSFGSQTLSRQPRSHSEPEDWPMHQVYARILDDPPPEWQIYGHWRECEVGFREAARASYRCGSCWADQFTTAYADRLCIVDKEYKMLSTYYSLLMYAGEDGCSGANGGVCAAIVDKGVVSGNIKAGEPATAGYCVHYNLPLCDPKQSPPDPKCPKGKDMIIQPHKNIPACDDGRPIDTVNKTERIGINRGDCRIATDQRHPDQNVRLIQMQLMEHGTLTAEYYAGMKFKKLNEKSGLNVFDTEEREGKPTNHFLNLIGWGKKDGKPYWLVKSNWGHEWGFYGTARVALGKNLNQIEHQVYYIAVKQSKEDKSPIKMRLLLPKQKADPSVICWSRDLLDSCPKDQKPTATKIQYTYFECYNRRSENAKWVMANTQQELPPPDYSKAYFTSTPHYCV